MEGTLQEILAIHPSALVRFGKYKAIAATDQKQVSLNVLEKQASGHMSCTLSTYDSEHWRRWVCLKGLSGAELAPLLRRIDVLILHEWGACGEKQGLE
jgi:hypothetical protein